MSVSKALFSLTPLNADVYELNIAFTGDQNTVVSSKQFTFTTPSAPLQDGEILDIYSLNGVCAADVMGHLFQKSDEQGVTRAAAKVKKLAPTGGPKMLVLDLQEPHTKYAPCAECHSASIALCEKAVCDFFAASAAPDSVSKRAQKIHKLCAETGLDLILCEGSLKEDLLHELSEEQASFFNSKAGSSSFCQCAEFFMNGFKFGQTVHGASILADKYIVPISTKFPALVGHQKSTVLYPSCYQDIYAVDGPFFETMKPVFTISGGGLDEVTKITTVTVEPK